MMKINLNSFAPKRSANTLLNALRRWFAAYVGISIMKTPNGHIKIRNIILGNYATFSMLLDATTRRYKATKTQEIEQKVQEVEHWNPQWEISKIRHFNPENYNEHKQYNLAIYDPCYLSFDSAIEQEFVEYLESKEEYIEWWWQNGSEHMALNFGIKYNSKSTFQPDFIVQFKDGRIGIFDTKGVGFQEDDNRLKAEALHTYIEAENRSGRNLIGGIIIKDREHFYIHHKKAYQGFKEKAQEWEYLEACLFQS